jgi:acetoin utilization deacetylase AcuC-like enzyme
MTTALVYSEEYLEHKPGWGHPERPERLKAIVDALRLAKLWETPSVKVVKPKPAKREDIELVHEPSYIEFVERLSKSERPLDGDTPVRKNTYELALLAAGGTIDAGRAVLLENVSNAFALVRPPGHHAFRARGGGFCYFNNLAVMIGCLKREFRLRRIFVLDFDAHNGNGTQDIFYDDPSVLCMSLHQDPLTLYPGTGFIDEVGSGEGEGYTVNVPMAPGSGDAEYTSAMEEIFVPLTEQFKPELFAVSAGFDAHAEDPLTQLRLSTLAYGWLTRFVMEQAERVCKGRAVFVLEGGYALDALAGGAVNIVKVMTGEKIPVSVKPRRPSVIDELKRVLANYWKL